MKAKHVILYLLLAIVSFSCIGEEALNAEADILSCALPGVAMTTSPIINNNSITIFVGPGTDISELKPEFTLTPGAAISPLSGTERNFNTPQEYTVTAADGVWKKTYIISVYNRENETYNFLKRNVQFSLFFHPIKAKAFNHIQAVIKCLLNVCKKREKCCFFNRILSALYLLNS